MVDKRGRLLARSLVYILITLSALYILFHHDDPQDVNIVVVYRGTWLVVLYVFLCGLNFFIWEKYNINYALIFGIDSKNVHSYYLDFFEAAASLAFLWSVGIIFYMIYTRGGYYWLSSAPISLSFVFWMLLLSPTPFYKGARLWIWNHIAGFFWGPFAIINFASCWVADQLTSATVALVDFEYTFCHYFFYLANINCDSFHKILQPTCVAFPFVWRLMQCMCQYRDTSNTAHALNAGKYATSLIAITFSTLHLVTQDDPNMWSVYRTYWVVAVSASTLYSYAWDLVMDWGLLRRNALTATWHVREVLVFEHHLVYYVASVTNLVMRSTWMIALNPEYFGIHFRRDILVFFLASVELIRRIQWNFFRMEYEHVLRSGNKASTKHGIDDSTEPIDAN